MSIATRLSGTMKGGASKRLLFIGVAIIVVAGAVFFLSPADENINPAVVRASPMTQPTVQGRDAVTPAMNEELALADQQRIDAAVKEGGSAIPTIRVGDSSRLELDLTSNIEDDLIIPDRPAAPEIELPIIAPPVNAIVARPLAIPAQAAPNPQYDGMRAAMESLQPQSYSAATVTYFYDGTNDREEPAVAAAPRPLPAGLSGFVGAESPAPGTIVYARMVTEANSDAPGPILAEVLQGEYAGARLIGRFSSTRSKLVLEFTTMTFEKESFGEKVARSVPIEAVAVDAKTIGAGVATSVDYHLLENVGITLAASFAQGFGRAVADTGSSVVSNGGGLVIANPGLTAEEQLYVAGGEAAAAAGQSLNQLFGNRAPTIKVAAGTPVGIFFLSDEVTR